MFSRKLYKKDKSKRNEFRKILDIWDTPVDELYINILEFFIKDANAFIMGYDITSKSSFNSIQNFWYPSLKKRCLKNPSKIYYLI